MMVSSLQISTNMNVLTLRTRRIAHAVGVHCAVNERLELRKGQVELEVQGSGALIQALQVMMHGQQHAAVQAQACETGQ